MSVLLSFTNINFADFCRLMQHYMVIGIDPDSIVPLHSLSEDLRNKLSLKLAAFTPAPELTEVAAIMAFECFDLSFHWHSRTQQITVLRTSDKQCVLLKSGTGPITNVS